MDKHGFIILLSMISSMSFTGERKLVQVMFLVPFTKEMLRGRNHSHPLSLTWLVRLASNMPQLSHHHNVKLTATSFDPKAMQKSSLNLSYYFMMNIIIDSGIRCKTLTEYFLCTTVLSFRITAKISINRKCQRYFTGHSYFLPLDCFLGACCSACMCCVSPLQREALRILL